jgi:ubiquinone/menaquinone biosynthesis C-methylase UbiE
MSEIKWNSKGYQKFDDEKARDYAEIANQVFAPIYPVIAGQIMDRCRIEEGLALDLGAGCANLAMAMARISRLKMVALDFSWPIQKLAQEAIEKAGLQESVKPLAGDVHRLPLQDRIAALVVSRGSMRFWRNKPAVFREIFRVLKPGGKGYVGGGMGSSSLGEQIDREMRERGAEWKKGPKRKFQNRDRTYFKEMITRSGFRKFEIVQNDSGFWIYLEKERGES